MGTWSFPGVKRPGRGADHPPSSSAEVEGRVELYIYSPSGPSWPVLGRILPLLYANFYTNLKEIILGKLATESNRKLSCIFELGEALLYCIRLLLHIWRIKNI
jgi:hypothetical protein